MARCCEDMRSVNLGDFPISHISRISSWNYSPCKYPSHRMVRTFSHGVKVNQYSSHSYVLSVIRIQGHLRKSMKCKKCSKEHFIFIRENLALLSSPSTLGAVKIWNTSIIAVTLQKETATHSSIPA